MARFASSDTGSASLAWLASGLTFRALGGRFDSSELTSSWQFLDPVLLETRLGESLLYLHAQPPGFNLLLGLVLKLAPSAYPTVFAAGFALLSLALLVVLAKLLAAFGARGGGRLLLLFLFALSPGFMLYGHSLFYTQLEALLISGAALALARTLERRRASLAFASFCACVAALALVRAAYHLGFVVGSVGLGLLAARQNGARLRRLAPAALGSLLLVSAVYAKNGVVFGQFTASSWLGMNLAKVVVPQVPNARLHQLVEAGAISRLALVEPFSPLTAYEPLPVLPRRFARIPALTERTKRTGELNMNHAAYLELSQTLLRDSLALVQREPRAYAHGVARALSLYLESNGQCLGLRGNLEPLQRWRALYEPLVYGRRSHPHEAGEFQYPLLALSIATTTLLLLWLAATRAGTFEQRWLLRFLAWCIVYVGAVSSALDLGENARFRYAVDPLYLVAACAAWRLFTAHPTWRRAAYKTAPLSP